MHILNMLSMLCWGVVCVCYHLCPRNHMAGHIQSAIVDHGGFCCGCGCCCCCCFFFIPVDF